MQANTLHQGDLCVSDYFTKLRILWDELESFRPDPICTCKPKCSCPLSSILNQRKLEDQSMQFLRGLNDQFTNIKPQMFLLDPMPAVTKFFSSILQQERQLAAAHPSVSNRDTLAPSSGNYNSSSTHSVAASSTLVCTFCHKSGYTEVVCYRKHGFPGQDNKNSKPQSTRKLCTFFNKSGHTIEVFFDKHGCPLRYKFPNGHQPHINNVSTQDNAPTATDQSDKDHIRLTPQQYQILADLFKNASNTNNVVHANQIGVATSNQSNTGNIPSKPLPLHSNHTWIVDSDTTYHICVSLHYFSSFKGITPVIISLPNGSSINAHYSGTVTFFKKFKLYNVLYVPSFCFNLISVSKLLSSLHHTLTFTSYSCVIQDLTTNKRIGSVKLHDGLYLLHSQDFLHNSSFCYATIPLSWHSRLGHPSNDRLTLLQKKYSYISTNKNYVCDACHKAKHKKPPFPLSSSRSFDLIHMDIWGPCTISMNGFKYFLTIVDDYSRYTWVILLPDKTSIHKHIIDFVTKIETHFHTVIKNIRTNNGLEFYLHDFYSTKGITHQTTCTYTPEQNGIVEPNTKTSSIPLVLSFFMLIFLPFFGALLLSMLFFLLIAYPPLY